MVTFNMTCNATLDDLRILPTSEIAIIGSLTFHQFSIYLGGACTVFAIVLSLYLVFRHATNYTKPREQKHIIRILFMVPIYAAASWLCIVYYWHFIYFQVISDCYEAFAISSFFALLCHYVGPDLHEQKEYFRQMDPVKPWVFPLNLLRKCCGGRGGRGGPWRTPKSGLTWFNIIWIGIYQYCFIRVAMTITAVVTQYFGRYCESSDSPVFSHIWILVIESVAVTIAMYCVIQFYIQMRLPLAEHKPFLKVLAIKLVIFLSFWQSTMISLGTSTLNIVHANSVLAYPDIKVVIPSLLLCLEMACFAILHLWAFPYKPYRKGAPVAFYPNVDPNTPPKENEHYAASGGFMGLMAIVDAANIWDVVKAFGRGVRWLFVGVRHRREDSSYLRRKDSDLSMDNMSPQKPGAYGGGGLDDVSYKGGAFQSQHRQQKSTDHLPIASQFRSSTFNQGRYGHGGGGGGGVMPTIYDPDQGSMGEESAGLIENAQPNPRLRPGDVSGSPYRDQRMQQQQQQRYVDDAPQSYSAQGYPPSGGSSRGRSPAVADGGYEYGGGGGSGGGGADETQARVHQALYGQAR